ncbi:MAG: hypothetical protein WBA12_06695 [Catalinimonas sp.]
MHFPKLLRPAVLGLGLLAGCRNDVPPPAPLPNVFVDERISLTDPRYQALRLPGGAVTVPGGLKGLIIYHEGNSRYFAIERQCTFQPDDPCSTVGVDGSGLFMVDTCCGSQFAFPDGRVLAPPATFPLRNYVVQQSGNTLRVLN